MTGRDRVALFVVALATGCEPVPSLTFENASADADADADAEAGADADADAGDGGCPSAVPPGAALCCGPTPCYGTMCNPSNCFNCNCTSHQICCFKANNTLGCTSEMALASCH
jgi:hypothetical protein